MGVTIISRQFFSTLAGMGSRSHDFDDELEISLFNFIICRTLKRVYFGSNFCFLHRWNIMYFILNFGTDSCNLIHKIFRKMHSVNMW